MCDEINPMAAGLALMRVSAVSFLRTASNNKIIVLLKNDESARRELARREVGWFKRHDPKTGFYIVEFDCRLPSDFLKALRVADEIATPQEIYTIADKIDAFIGDYQNETQPARLLCTKTGDKWKRA